MPLVELILPEDGPAAAAEAAAPALCALAIRAMGGDPACAAARETTRCEVARRRIVAADGRRGDLLRAAFTLPAGSLSRVRKARLAAEATEILARAAGEAARHRVWVTIHETAEFAAAGRFWTRREIAEWVRRARAGAA